MKITWSKRSLLDIGNIFNYIKKDSEKYAKDFISEIRDKVNILENFPEIGKVSIVSDQNKNLRELIINKNYIVTYYLKIESDEVEIIQVWHTKRNKF
jgi:addiction module RelE/StbE family toxin